MTPPTLTSRRALLSVFLAGTMALTVGACGRRGRPEPPPNPDAAPKQSGKASTDKSKGKTAQKASGDSDDDDTDDDEPVNITPQPVPTGRKKNRPFEVPKQPFILDSLL